MENVKMSKEEQKKMQEWQAQDDARTMALYQEILQDKARLNRATKEASKQSKELQKRATMMNKVAKKGVK